MNGPGEAAAGAERPAFCSYRPVPGEFLTAACVECGHALALHIGVEHCPVCELVHHNRQVRAAITNSGVHVEVTGVDTRALEDVLRRVIERDRFGRGGYGLA
jgi:hypothetical protein